MVYCTILLYHAIRDDEVVRFKKQMNILKKVTTAIPLDYNGPFDNKKFYSIITFDDAFKNVITNAAPELIKLNIPFTIFIPVGQLGSNAGWLTNSGHRDEHETVSSIDELLSIPPDIVTFGSHTINHHSLCQLDHESACVEIRESKSMLESQLQKKIEYFAFPHGAYNPRLIACCRETGYKQIFSIAPEPPITSLRNYLKGRIEINPSNWKIEFILKILGGYGWKALTRSVRRMLKC